MKNSSLEIATEIIMETLNNTNRLDNLDKIELMRNIVEFLNEKEYRKNVKILEKSIDRKSHMC